jgi:hypothetical protein
MHQQGRTPEQEKQNITEPLPENFWLKNEKQVI